jgi:hypothetical protein
MNDPLAAFRKKPSGPGSETAPPETPEGYVAFDAKDKVDRLKIRRANATTRSPGYAYLLDVVYDGAYGTNFVLVYTFLMVMVRGSNLQPVVTALQMGTADFIQEFDADRWQIPKDDKAPFIESIEVVVQENGPSIAEAEQSANQREKGHTRH